jgi:tetratricopeptide (TPR) repeat protein
MTQSFRRTLVWTIIALLLLLGTMLQLRASPRAAPHDDAVIQNEQEGLLQAFGCTVSLLSFHLPQAEEACGNAIILLPDSPLGYKFRGYTYLLEHRFERAEADLREAVRLDPRDPDNLAGLGQSLSGQGRFDDAIESFGRALTLQPRDVRYLAARCWALAGQGQDLSAALADCNLAVTLAPHLAVAYGARGLVHLKETEYALAALDYSKSLRLEKNQPSALFGRGIAEWRLGRIDQAKSDLSLARVRDPEIDDTYILVGILEDGCRTGTGICSLPEALKSKPLSPSSPYLSVSLGAGAAPATSYQRRIRPTSR